MSSQAFFWVNVSLGLFLILIFLIGKRGIVAPSKLNLKKGRSGRGIVPKGAGFHSTSVDLANEVVGEKNLNVLFVYNGHTFDAYEVLGAPAGASLEMVQRFYQEALARKGKDADFLEAAYFAIKTSLRK